MIYIYETDMDYTVKDDELKKFINAETVDRKT